MKLYNFVASYISLDALAVKTVYFQNDFWM